MNPEQYFFRYAWPCTEMLLIRKKISEVRYKELKFSAESNITPSRKILEDTYKTAISQLKKISSDYWHIPVIRKYFLEEHNRFIDSGEPEIAKCTPAQRELCKVYTGVVGEVKKAGDYDVVIVRYGKSERRCINLYGLELKKGDAVTVHYNFVIEKKR
ncbi:MAG TPA: hypothetical protein VJC00_03145 [Candidatus Nanoarchaeia archaeon]|nr:hypothetical protein [Candidatus Nanoarchaeia archaeon]